MNQQIQEIKARQESNSYKCYQSNIDVVYLLFELERANAMLVKLQEENAEFMAKFDRIADCSNCSGCDCTA
jgi:hypothetical protein